MSESLWVGLLGAGGAGAALLALINGVINWLNGSHDREKVRARTVAERIAEAERREQQAHDDETEVRRELAYEIETSNIFRRHSAELSALCIRHGTPAVDLPAWPVRMPYSSLRDDEKPEPEPKET